jgi:opacity protein-like surface antigen
MSIPDSRFFLIALLMLWGGGGSAIANESKNYAGFQYGMVEVESSSAGIPMSHEPTALVGRMGSFINRYLALEARVGFGFSDDKATMSRLDATEENEIIDQYGLDVENLFGFYLLGNLTVVNTVDLYGVIGITSLDVGTTTGQTIVNIATSDELVAFTKTGSRTENGLSYGLGGRVGITEKSSLNLEYMSYIDKSDFTFNSINIGFLFDF